MKQIVQTGSVPVNSLGTVFINYLKYFKVYFCFGIIPSIICFTSMFFVLKDKALVLSQQLISVQPILLTNNKDLIIPALKGLLSTVFSILLAPTFLCTALINIVIGIIAFSCLFVGIKHTFYERMDLGAILKEGFNNTFRCIWTMITYFLAYVVLMIVATMLNHMVISFVQGFDPIVARVISLAISLFLSATIMFYPCIHLFAANNPFSTMYFSLTTLCKSFLSWLIVVLIYVFVNIVIWGGVAFIIITIIFGGQFVNINYTTVIILGTIAILVLPYLTNMSQIMLGIMTFIAYPELLDNYHPVPSDKSNTPFLNQRSNNEDFDKWTSK